MKYLFFHALFLLPFFVSAQQIFQVSANNPDSINFSDLHFLRDVLKGVEVIGLGEQSHGDGATFDAKVRLIKYLHEELGFNVIAFESGIYDCTKANEYIQKGEMAEEYLFKAIFGIWHSKELKKLARYIDKTRNSDNPLQLTGFDVQFAGSLSKTDLIKDLFAFTHNLELKTGAKIIGDSSALSKSIGKVIKFSNYHKRTPPGDTAIISKNFDQIFSVIRNSNVTDANTNYWVRILNSIIAECRSKYMNNFTRDSMMAANALWLAKEKYPQEKIILWGANTHLSYNLRSVDSKYLSRKKMMGDYLKSTLGKKYYNVGFTSYEGKAKAGFLNLKVKRPAEKGVEQWLYENGDSFSFLTLRSAQRGDFTSFAGNSKIFGHTPVKMNVFDVADGIF